MATVRCAANSDLTALLGLYRELHAEDPDVPLERAEAVWSQIMSDDHRTVFVAEVAGRVVGTVEVWVMANLTRGARPIGIVENVVVQDEFRRHGIGRQLMKVAVDHLAASGCYKAQLAVADAAAQSFYRSVGFDDASVTLKRRL